MGGYLAKSANMMRHAANKPVSPALGIFSRLRYAVFGRICDSPRRGRPFVSKVISEKSRHASGPAFAESQHRRIRPSHKLKH
jgi:hypothetical protein